MSGFGGAIVILLILLIVRWLFRRLFRKAQSGGQSDLYPPYAKAFYGKLKVIACEPLPECHPISDTTSVEALKAAATKTAGAGSLASLVAIHGDPDPEGHEVMWRLDYVAPDKFHVLQMGGNDIDEWIIDGETAWSGPIMIETATENLVHAEAHANVWVAQYLESFVDQAIENCPISMADAGRVWQIEGPFNHFENISNFMMMAGKATFVIGSNGFLERLDLSLTPEAVEEDISADVRVTFGAFDCEIRIPTPEPVGEKDENGQLIIQNLTIQDHPFYEV